MKTPEETIDAIQAVARQIGFTGTNWPRLRIALIENGVTTRRGGSWNSVQALEQFCHRNGVVFAGEEAQTVSETPPRPARTDEAEQLELVADEMHVAMQDVEMEISQAISEQTALPEPVDTQLEVAPLSPSEIVLLREIIAAWQNEPGVPIPTAEPVPTYRPAFPGERDNTGIRVNRRLLKAALEKAKTEDAALTGGGKLSPLIEHLLWGYLGYDPRFLKP
jgi:hypothetical protein